MSEIVLGVFVLAVGAMGWWVASESSERETRREIACAEIVDSLGLVGEWPLYYAPMSPPFVLDCESPK